MNKLFIFLLLCFTSTFLFAQEQRFCFDFEELTPDEVYSENTDYQAGDTIFERAAASAILFPIIDRNGNTDFFSARVTQNPFNFSPSNFVFSQGLLLENISIHFDFSDLSASITQLSINFIDGGAPENIAVNGARVEILTSLNQLRQDIAPGVSAILEMDSSIVDNLEYGTLFLEGNIESFVIGGEQLFIDDLCIGNAITAGCGIRNIAIAPQECFDNERYTAILDFEYEETEEELFNYFLNDELIGSRRLDELPVVLDLPYQQNSEIATVSVCVEGNNPCCEGIDYIQPNCDFVGDCAIEFIDLHATPCDDNGEFFVNFFVGVTDGSNQGYLIEDIFNNTFGPFAYLDSTVVLGPYSDLDDVPLVFKVIDAANENCSAQRALFDICPSCRFEEVFFEPYPCDENNQFLLDIFVLAQGGSEAGFLVNYMGEEFGPFSYQDSLVTIGPLSTGFDAPPEIFLFDAENLNCFYSEIINAPCGLNCELRVAAELTDCDTNGAFFAEVLAEGGFSEYTVEAGGQTWGPFAYGDRNVRIGPFQSTTRESFFIIIHDQTLSYCTDTLALENPCFSSACSIEDIVVETTECKDDGSFGLFIQYNVPTDGLDTIALQYQDRILGYYPANELIEIENFVFRRENFVRLCLINGNEECCEEVFFEVPNGCEGGGGSCIIENVRIRPTACNDEGLFNVELGVFPENAGENGFTVDVFGEIFGPFSYADSFAVIGPFGGNTEEVYEIIVSDFDRPECFYADIFRSPCRSNTCGVADVEITVSACDTNAQFELEIFLRNPNPIGEGFVVTTNGRDYGPFSYADSLIVIGPIDGNSNAPFEILIQDLIDRNCFFRAEAFSPCSETCRLTDLSVETGECNEDDSFNLIIDVDAQNITNDSIDIFYNGRFLNTFSAFDLPILYNDFRVNATDSLHFIRLCVKDNPDCCVRQEIFPPCFTSNCHIQRVIAEPLICENNEFKVDIFVESTQPNLTGYFIQVNEGQFFGPFSYEQEFVTIGPFPGDGNTIYRVSVVDGEDRSCRNGTRFQAVSCANQCNINDLVLEVGEICRDDGTFPLSIDLDIQNPIGMGYSVFLEDQLLGTYPYGSDPLFFPRFDIGGRASATIAVIAGENRNCAIRKILEAPECSIDTSDLWPGDTNSDGFVHHFDLLNIGLAYGAEGPARLEGTLDFRAMDAPRWEQAFEDGVNYKHADTNGDGRVDELDVEVIELNYGQNNAGNDTDAPAPEVDVEATENDPSIFVDLPETGDFPNGTAFSVPVILGSEDRSVESVYGIAFSIEYNPSVIDPNSLQLTIPDTWLGDTENDLLMIQHSYPERGLIEVAISRTDGESVTGYGVIALMSGIIVDLVGLQTVSARVSKVKAISSDMNIIPIFPEERGTKITTSAHNLVESALRFYPNPAQDILQIENMDGRVIEQIEIVNAQGQVVQLFRQPGSQISLQHIPSGLYVLRIQSKESLLHQQILKQ
ncbi:MAG: T9SS type A sorting domain-containing protein [Bacteroidota bacterium]